MERPTAEGVFFFPGLLRMMLIHLIYVYVCISQWPFIYLFNWAKSILRKILKLINRHRKHRSILFTVPKKNALYHCYWHRPPLVYGQPLTVDGCGLVPLTGY